MVFVSIQKRLNTNKERKKEAKGDEAALKSTGEGDVVQGKASSFTELGFGITVNP